MKKCIVYTFNDVFISNKISDKNFSDLPYIILEYLSNGNDRSIFVGLLKFELDKLYNVRDIENANLYLYIEKYQYSDIDIDKSYIEVFINSSEYNINNICWNNAPDIEQTGIIKEKLIEGQYLKINIKNIVNKWLYSRMDNNGIAIVLRGSNERVYICSSRGDNEPYLEIEWKHSITDINLNNEDNIQGENFQYSNMNLNRNKSSYIDIEDYDGINKKEIIENYFNTQYETEIIDKYKIVEELEIIKNTQLRGVRDTLIPNGSLIQWVGYNNEVSTDILLVGGSSYFIGVKISTIVSCDKCFVGGVIYLNGSELEDTTIISALVDKGKCISIYGSTILDIEINSILQIEYITNNELPSNKEYASSLTIFRVS